MKGLRRKCLGSLVLLHATLLAGPAEAQYYDAVYTDEGGPTILQKIMTGPAAGLLMVFVGALGLLLFATAGEKGEQAERRQMYGFICIIAVVMMVYYRFSLWNDPAFNR